MGSRLETNSTLVRKRIESHTFSDEQGEEYEGSKFGGFADYMRRKKIKLQNLDAEIRATAGDKPPIFRGVVVHVNGYTQPSLSDLHTLVVSHGGGFLQYLDGKTAVTHVVASNLTPKKAVEFARYRIVKPGWIVDSVKAGKLLPWDAYRLVDEGVTQKILRFDGGQIVSQANTQQQSYKDQSENSWYTTQFRQTSREVPSNEPSPSLVVPTEQQQDDIDEDSQEEDSLGLDRLDQGTDSAGKDEDKASSDEAVHATRPAEVGQTEQHAPQPQSSELSRAGSSSGKPSMPEKRPLTAEEHNAILLSNPHLAKSSTANPDFLNQYYRESRLHHLSTWKAELKAQMQARAQEKVSSQKARQKRAAGTRRYIMHVDFDSFFAAVSLRKHPHLVDKPVVIAHGSGPGSEIASCNYPARKYGIKNGMWMKAAQGMCPDLHVLPYDYKAYEEASRQFYDCILAIDGAVQSISIDEALVDISEQCIKAGGSDGRGVSEGSIYREQECAQGIAQALRTSVKETTGCDVSVGIGGNILLAKVALRKAKPAGQHLIKPEEVLSFIGELTVTELPGVAWSIGNKLEEIGIKYVKDIRACTKERLVNTLGPKTGEKLWDYSRGIDRQEVGDQVVRKSVSAEVNWGIRFVNQQQAEEFVQSLCDELSRRLLEQLVKGKQLTMKIMRKAADAGLDPPKSLGHGKCDTFNKSVALGVATTEGAILGKEAISILRSYGFPPGELRGLGVQMQKLEPLKPSASGSSTLLDSSQRRLQFKKPLPSTTQTPVQPQSRATTPPKASTPRIKNVVDPIEEIPTPEKPKVDNTIPSALDAPRGQNGAVVPDRVKDIPLNISGTQFIVPSQIDPTVLAELPADIRAKLEPKQRTILDSMASKARPTPPPAATLSRSASPYLSDGDAMLPSESQLDPEALAALPADVREEVLAQYQALKKPDRARHQALLPQSPHKNRTLPPTRKPPVTPIKRQKTTSLFGKSRAKRTGDGGPTLTQSNFVALVKNDSGPDESTSHAADEVSESFLSELPEEIRLEILAEQKRNRMKMKSGLNFENGRKKVKAVGQDDADLRGQQRLQLARTVEKPTFTSQKLSSLPELRDVVAAWVRECSTDGEGPDQDDVSALSDYLSRVVSIERDMAKAVAVVHWLGIVMEYENFKCDQVRRWWEEALDVLKRDVQSAVKKRGLPPVVFDC
ncbi:deoxycytidyl transferase [Exophiala dermatitidis]|uniref:DNA repair protein REV1 n=1 Tax=Exophiala dermatitidis TaxID=5970 RepID=A0AAN6EJP6_EXODE|nr:deoxycytidyl transferase [Exophiala dermatitidis]KAJ4502375.1 deoxycytidyl transferase [Exophiala dermatitidis]KAJ4502940.1 deoxycytidyl transferase [Exophiala dermatitidis]KAJ4530402.1 deoxycytidyl transferase [Exophiala dermatitidis]KAJ4531582.1 deoxycytidyl transferase [Exophiala dermatitidis]